MPVQEHTQSQPAAGQQARMQAVSSASAHLAQPRHEKAQLLLALSQLSPAAEVDPQMAHDGVHDDLQGQPVSCRGRQSLSTSARQHLSSPGACRCWHEGGRSVVAGVGIHSGPYQLEMLLTHLGCQCDQHICSQEASLKCHAQAAVAWALLWPSGCTNGHTCLLLMCVNPGGDDLQRS